MRYSFKGALPSNLKTIAIPLFEDRSVWVGLQEQLTEAVINAFVQDNSLQVTDNQDEADLVLTAVILPVRIRQTAIRRDEVVEEQELVVSVKVECLNTHTNKPLWSATVSDFGRVSGQADLEEQDAAVSEAVEKLVEDIVNRTIAAW